MPTDKVITDNFEDGEDLCCELPHATDFERAELSFRETLTVEKAQRMSEFLGFLADTNRLQILSILSTQEMCVGSSVYLFVCRFYGYAGNCNVDIP